ncbi:hypothetical protein [Alistipes finegoldii]|jgi:hypothetical protein|uniref:hypothetical protein n=1 Tax=Alistipes finegoldii TaxID=214856 RepID=UPI002803F17D|nr:hypothetical protein [uncultured Alistipes sp.]
MKSKRAQKELEKLEKFYPFSGWIAPSDTYRIAEIAEREAEERMRKKAIEAYCSECTCYETGVCALDPDKCATKLLFVQNMSKK